MRAILQSPTQTTRMLLVFALVFLTARIAAVRPAQAQPALQGQSPPAEQHALESVAACGNVPYGEPVESAFDYRAPEDQAQTVAPPSGDAVMLVDLGLFVEELTDIDELSSTFALEGYMDMVWCDPTQTFDPDDLGWPVAIFDGYEADLKMRGIWGPDIVFPNEAGNRETEDKKLTIFPDGTVEYEEKFSARLEMVYDLRQFPFDSQLLEIEMESFSWSDNEMLLHEQTDRIGFGDDFEIPEWHTEALRTEIRTIQEIRQNEPFSEMVMEIEITRRSGFYIWKMIVPLVMLVVLAWSVFWMHGESVPDRLSVSIVGVLTVVAYQFVITDSLPRVPYITFMDSFFVISYISMILAALENVAAGIVASEGNEEFELSLDRTSRWAFPLGFALSMAVVIVIYF